MCSSFYAWLSRQTERQDPVGAFARYAAKDKILARLPDVDLHVLLSRFDGLPEQREMVKVAHREWRQQRREGR